MQGMASNDNDVAAPADEACKGKDRTEPPSPAANAHDKPSGQEGSSTDRTNEPLNPAKATRSKDDREILPSFRGTLRRKKKVAGLREAAS